MDALSPVMRLALALALLAAAGCAPRPAAVADADGSRPMDPALRHHLATVGPDVRVDVLVGIGTHDADAARRALGEAGMEVRTLAGDVAVARGTRDAIERASTLPWVEQIALSPERPPLAP